MAKFSNHDISSGPLSYCQICFSKNLELVIDLGHQPLCDSLLTESQLNQPEMTYPLRLFRCLECSCTQLDYVVPGEVVYHKEYPYRCGITKEVVDHHHASSAEIVRKYGLGKDSLVIDIGSNDGTLLSGFKKAGTRVLGVEPTNIAKIALENGIETIQSFFTEKLAGEIVKDYGHTSLTTATNVFAHMATLGEVMRGASRVLKEDGLFITESHYLLDILELAQYDTIYHEHLRSYSLKSLVRLFEMYDFTVIDAQRIDRYAGSIHIVAQKGLGRTISENVRKLLAAEEAYGLYKPEVYERFRKQVLKTKNDLLALALDASAKGLRFVGNSCPGRSSTLLNFTGISKDLMPYIAEQPTSLKLGMYLPGKHIPIVKNEILFREQPDYVVLLAWHYWKPIAELLRKGGLKSKLVIPLPEVRILES